MPRLSTRDLLDQARAQSLSRSLVASNDPLRALRKSRGADAGGVYAEPPTAAENSPGLLSSALALPFDAALKGLDALNYLAATTRAGVNLVAGGPATGRKTILGRAPSGRELMGWGSGTKGQFDAVDVPGTVVEMVLDPVNLLSFGTVTAAGRALRTASGLADLARAGGVARTAQLAELAAGTEGVTAPALEAARKLAGLGYKTLAEVPVMPRSLSEQAAQGLRRGLALDIPWGPKLPLSVAGGKLSGSVLGALDTAGQTLARVGEPLLSKLRPGGRTAPAAWAAGAEAPASAYLGRGASELFNARVSSGQGVESESAYLAAETMGAAARRLRAYAAAHPEEALAAHAATRAQLEPIMQSVRDRLLPKIAAAEHAGDFGAAAAQRKLLTQTLEQLNIVGSDTADALVATRRLTVAGIEKGPEALAKVQDTMAKLIAKHAEDSVRRNQKVLAAMEKVGPSSIELAAANPYVGQAGMKELVESKTGAMEALWSKAQAAQQRADAKLASRLLTLGAHEQAMQVVIQNLPGQLGHEAQRISAALGEGFAKDIASGQKLGTLNDMLLAYLPRRLVPGAAEQAAKLPADDVLYRLVKEFNTSGRYAKERVTALRGISIPAINDMWRARGMQGDLFIEDPAEAAVRRLLEGAHVQGGAHVASGALDLFAMPKLTAGPDAVPVADLIHKLRLGRVGRLQLEWKTPEDIAQAIAGTKLEQAYVPAPIAKALTQVYRLVDDPQSLQGMFKVIARWNAVLRVGVTQAFPPFHVRNEVGNWTMMALAGMRPQDATYLVRAGELQSRMGAFWAKEGGKESGRIATAAEQRLYLDAVRDAGIGRNFAREAGELWTQSRPAATTLPQKIVQTAAAPLRKITQTGIRVGNALEDNSKLALYLWARDKGVTSAEAGALVKRYLFDYSDLSFTEKKWLRQMAYFYTYTRKAIPVLLAEAVRQPRLFRLAAYMTGNAGSNGEEARRMLPEWAQANLPAYLGQDERGRVRFANMGLPIEQLTQFASEGRGVGRSLQKVLAAMAPLPRLPLEMLMDYNLRAGRRGFMEDPALRQLAAELPVSVRRQMQGAAALGTLLPTTRLTGTLERGGQWLTGGERERGRGALDTPLANTLGVNVLRLEPREAKVRQTLNRVDDALQRYEAMAAGDTPRAKALRSLRGRLRRELQQLRK